jgi:hypothetical protein
MFKVNDEVVYTYIKSGKIENVHYDNAPELYYTIDLGDRHPQTTKKNLISKNKLNTDYCKGDIVIYHKKYNTKILDIKDKKYKICYNNKIKYVSENKLSYT